jgi:hypothetical protein
MSYNHNETLSWAEKYVGPIVGVAIVASIFVIIAVKISLFYLS